MPENGASDPSRPSPDALLKQAQQEHRGRLKIFLGAAPGVGKTYEMLSVARRKLLAGVDVVVGVVETHGRVETEAQLDGIELIPRRSESYRERVLQEMDLDAILSRRPQLVLVDELAHSNAPGSRHPKRYQDVQELLAAGIDVFSTLNIQHVASLNDVVASITRVQVRETVPDSVLEQADEIEVVDLTPDDLMQRLREGKVYRGEAAERALDNYFTPSNLTALRELALRRTAQRVDEQLRQQRRVQGVSEVWAASERVLTCINESPGAEALVRHAKRVADRFGAPWTAVYVETERSRQLSEAQRDTVAQTLRLAEHLGADTLTLPGEHIADDVLRICREQNVTQLIVAKSRRSRWFEWLHGSVVDELVRNSGNIAVQVIAGSNDTGAHAAKSARAETRAIAWGRPGEYVATALWVAVATLAGIAIDRAVGMSNVSLIFLPAVLLSATRYGLLPSLFGAIACSLSYNYFLLPPLYTFTIGDPDNVLAFVAFIVVAVLISHLTARTRTQTLAARAQATTTAELLNFSRKLAGQRKLDELLQATAQQVSQMLDVEAVLLVPADGQLQLRASAPATAALDQADVAAATWCLEKNRVTGRGSDTLPGARRLFLPLHNGSVGLAVIGVRHADGGARLAPAERRLLDALGDLAIIAFERIRLARDVDQARMLAETEKLRTALLTSISHDLRTPLASILGAVTSLRSYGNLYDETARNELLTTAQEETERMSRFVNNLLDMTRLDSGALAPKREACDVHDLAGSALNRAAKLLARHHVAVHIAQDMPMLLLDFTLMEQVLVNLLDNAAKYSPAGGAVEIAAQAHKYAVTLEVRDEGPGIAIDDAHRIFDPFFRVQQADRKTAGTGLGLAVCRGFIQAMGGRISAGNRRDRRGAVFTIEFPASLIAKPPAKPTSA
jgi:two-component system sensor histidine kinase KdpD